MKCPGEGVPAQQLVSFRMLFEQLAHRLRDLGAEHRARVEAMPRSLVSVARCCTENPLSIGSAAKSSATCEASTRMTGR